jgi:hypothetical protein
VALGAGSYTSDQLSAAGNALGTVSAEGYTGVSLWGLLGGNSTGTVSNVITDSGKNAILRSYLLATNSSGSQFIISLGEIDPFFGGGKSSSPFVSFAGGNGTAALIFPDLSEAGRNISSLTSLQVLSVSAPPVGAGGVSTSVLLAGNVKNPGVYTRSDLQSFPATTQTVNGNTYTGVALWDFLGANRSEEFNQYVLAEGTDGYEVLFSLAELDPALGAPLDQVPYADINGDFPADGVARIVIPGENHLGRYVSNLSLVEVASVPEPSTIGLPCFGFVGWMVLSRLRARSWMVQ